MAAQRTYKPLGVNFRKFRLNFAQVRINEPNSVSLAWWERSDRYRAKEMEFGGLMASAEKKACRKGKPTAFHIIKSLLVLTRLPFLYPYHTPHKNAAFVALNVLLFL